MKKPLNLFTFLCLLLLFSACQKTPVVTHNTTLLRKIITTNPGNSVYTDTFEYNSNNQLTKIIYSADIYTWTSVADIKYDADNRLIAANYTDVDEHGNVMQKTLSFSYFYVNNKIAKMLVTWGNNDSDYSKHGFTYDAQGRLIADTAFVEHTTQIDRISIYTWDANNNVVKTENYMPAANSTFVLGNEFDFAYDNGKNVRSNFNVPFYFLGDFLGYYLSTNNLINYQMQGDSPDVYTNEYDNNGRLMLTTLPHLPNLQQPTTFQYFYQ